MAQVMICSKFMNDVELRLYETVNYADDEAKKKGNAVHSTVFKKLTISGRNTYKRTKGILLPYSVSLVEKDIWDAIYAKNKDTDPLLKRGIIFPIKNELEAEAMSKEFGSTFCDLMTADENKNRAKRRTALTRAMV
jgi:hypothetical protein